MNTLYDVLQILKKFGTFIYTGNRLADLEFMQSEIKELYSFGLIDVDDYRLSLLIIRQEINKLKAEKVRKNE